LIDKKYIENNFEQFSDNLSKRGIDKGILDSLQELILKTKKNKQKMEECRAKQNTLSKSFGSIKQNGGSIDELKSEIALIKKDLSILTETQKELDENLLMAINPIPNLVSNDIPIGNDENDNIVIKEIGEIKKIDFEAKEHFELAEQNNWIDFKRGVKLAKSRFSLLRNNGALISRALQNFMLEHNREYGFEEINVPYIANSNSLFGSGQLPKFENDLFKIEGEELYLIPTSEVMLINMFNDEILNIKDLPLRLTSYSSCFRKEAGSAGRDTRGIIRQHQFEKVEIVSLCEPEKSEEEFNMMVECASSLLSKLDLPHRLVNLCSGDIGFCANKTIDLEVWLPGAKSFREISSISNTLDFQARRAKIRYKKDSKNLFVHSLNGSSLAIGRTIVAIMENHQDKNGNIKIPDVLIKYM